MTELRVFLIQLAHPLQHVRTASLDTSGREIRRKPGQETLAIRRPVRAVLLELHDVRATSQFLRTRYWLTAAAAPARA